MPRTAGSKSKLIRTRAGATPFGAPGQQPLVGELFPGALFLSHACRIPSANSIWQYLHSMGDPPNWTKVQLQEFFFLDKF